jgi:hypothetical protein
MKQQTLDQLRSIADVRDEPVHEVMSRTQRLERWAELLEKNPHRALTALGGTEYMPLDMRHLMRSDGSPITIAYDDPLLRAEGMQNDTYGEAKRFFQLKDRHLHEIVCDCRAGSVMQASRAARHVRAAIGGGNRFFARLREAFFL